MLRDRDRRVYHTLTITRPGSARSCAAWRQWHRTIATPASAPSSSPTSSRITVRCTLSARQRFRCGWSACRCRYARRRTARGRRHDQRPPCRCTWVVDGPRPDLARGAAPSGSRNPSGAIHAVASSAREILAGVLLSLRRSAHRVQSGRLGCLPVAHLQDSTAPGGTGDDCISQRLHRPARLLVVQGRRVAIHSAGGSSGMTLSNAGSTRGHLAAT